MIDYISYLYKSALDWGNDKVTNYHVKLFNYFSLVLPPFKLLLNMINILLIYMRMIYKLKFKLKN
jgi:hypothetical protein